MSGKFLASLPEGLSASGTVEQRLLAEYGAVFVAKGVTVPSRIVFRDESEVSEFQSGLSVESESIGGMRMELQSAAMNALRDAISDAGSQVLTVTPRDTDSARRSYNETVSLWASRVDPALDHWVAQNRLSKETADRIRSMSPFAQVSEILKLEAEGIYFAKDLSKSILYSVAPPGTSQHLSLLAFDIKEHADADVREVFARHRWFQTVVSDLPHFTYLGVAESELPDVGLRMVVNQDRRFWVPDI